MSVSPLPSPVSPSILFQVTFALSKMFIPQHLFIYTLFHFDISLREKSFVYISLCQFYNLFSVIAF